MSLKNLILLELKKINHINLEIDENQSRLIKIKSPSPMVKGVWLYCTDDDLEISLGNFTHFHINCYDSETKDLKNKRIVTTAVTFLSQLFDEEVVFYGSKLGGHWTYKKDFHQRGFLSKLLFGKTYTWNGPIKDKNL